MTPVNCGCGGKPIIYTNGAFQVKIYCEKCGIETYIFNSEAEAIEAWNNAMGVKSIKVPNKETVIVEPFTTDITHVGYCKCGYLVKEEWDYCPKCGRKIQWGVRYE